MKSKSWIVPGLLMLMLSLVFAAEGSAQEDRTASGAALSLMQKAEAAIKEENLAAAEAYYRKAIARDPGNAAAAYNLGNLYYEKEITPEAIQRHGQAASIADNKILKHSSFHNRGNAFMRQKKYKEAVEAYKNALRNNPDDDQTRYNLALAKKLLEKQQKGGGKDSNKKKKDQQKKDQQKKNDQKNQQGGKGDQKKENEGKPDPNKQGKQKNQKKDKGGQDQKDEQGKPQNKEQQEQKKGDGKGERQQPKPGQLSPQQVKNLLKAMANEEKKVQERINAEKVKGSPVQTEKDW